MSTTRPRARVPGEYPRRLRRFSVIIMIDAEIFAVDLQEFDHAHDPHALDEGYAGPRAHERLLRERRFLTPEGTIIHLLGIYQDEPTYPKEH